LKWDEMKKIVIQYDCTYSITKGENTYRKIFKTGESFIVEDKLEIPFKENKLSKTMAEILLASKQAKEIKKGKEK